MESSSPQEIAKHERWDRSNRLSLMYIQSHIAKGIRGSIVACFS
jgi:Asp/Glu/hydantoin racemase